jgi:tRNA modification GTPase
MNSGDGAMERERDTIFALASGRGRAGVAVIRVSGPRADDALMAMLKTRLPDERRASIRTLFDKLKTNKIDSALVLRFAPERSYTGENVVEYQVHGGPAVVSALLGELGRFPGLRLAEPGEFTRRAVENGRLDLTQAEAIADLVEAETEAQRRQAVGQLGGSLGQLYEGWRNELIRSAAWIEATIDFPDEEIPADALEASRQRIESIANKMQSHLNDGRRGEILRDGFHVAVIGAPNAGKSSLVNALAQRDVAIVSDIPGTTRDVLEVRLNLKGYPVILADTAGLRQGRDPIEQEGIRRAEARAKEADLRLLVVDGSADDQPRNLSGDIEVFSKADLNARGRAPGLWVSTKTGEGLSELVDRLAKHAEARMEVGEAPVLSRARHRVAVEKAERHLRDSLNASAPELAAEHLRSALREIGRITGRVDLDELLDVVFRDFCLGK